MVIFLDTSAIFALVDEDDPNNVDARRQLSEALQHGHELLLHNYVILESVALMNRRLGKKFSLQFLQEAQAFRIHWVDETLHRAAVQRFQERRGRFSLVDEVSFLVMREAGVRHALAFDKDFRREGFLPYQPT